MFNAKMIQRYLTPEQTKRLKIFSQTIASDLNPNDVKVLLVSVIEHMKIAVSNSGSLELL